MAILFDLHHNGKDGGLAISGNPNPWSWIGDALRTVPSRLQQFRLGHIGLLAVLSMARTLIGLAKTLMLTRGLPREAFGALIYAQTFVGLVDVFMFSGIYSAVLQYTGKGVAGVLAIAFRERLRFYPLTLLVGIGWAGYWWFQRSDLQVALMVLIATTLYPGTHIAACVEQSLIGQRRYVLQAWIALGLDVGSLLLALFCVYSGVTGAAVWFLALDGILRSVTLGALVVSEWRRERGKLPDPDEVKGFRQLAKKMTGLALVSSSQERLDSLMLGTFLGLGAFSDFALGLQIRNQVKMLWGAYYKTAYSRFTRSSVSQGWRLVKRDLVLIVIGFGLVILAIIVASPVAIPLLFSDKYESSVPYIAATLIGLWLLLPGALLEMLFRTRELVRMQYILRGGLMVSTIVLTPALILGYGIQGAAASRIMLGLIFSAIAVALSIWVRKTDAKTGNLSL